MNDEARMTNDELNPNDEIKAGSARFQRAAIGISADCTKPQTGAATEGKRRDSFDVRPSTFVISSVGHSSFRRP
jgi:hypothetical protein